MLLGIDLGTTYSAVSYLDNDGNPQIILNREEEPTTPSVVFVDGDKVIVGKKAREKGLNFPEKICKFVKRLMGYKEVALKEREEEYMPEAISAMIVKRLLEDALVQTEEPITGIVVTVPTFYTDEKRTATKQAVEAAIAAFCADKGFSQQVAGVQFISIIDEPKAAALYYSHKVKRDSGKVLIYDLGGGTFDAALVEISDDTVTVIAETEEHEAGGMHFDEKIREYIMDQILKKHSINLREGKYAGEYERLLLDAEICKKQLSDETVDEVKLKVNIGNHSVDVILTEEKFIELIDAIVQRTMYAVWDILEEKELEPNEIDEVVLVGGSSRIPYVRKCLQEIFPNELSEAVDPDKAVSYGAALYAGMLYQKITKDEVEDNVNVTLRLQDVCAHSIGLLLLDSKTKEKYDDVLIKANTPIIAEAKREYQIAYQNQTYIKMELTEGGTKFSETEIKLPQALAKGTKVELYIRVNFDHMIEVSMGIPAIKFTRDYKIERLKNLTEEEQKELSGLIASKTLE